MRMGPEPRVTTGLRESEAAPYKFVTVGEHPDFIKGAIASRNAVDPWTLKSRALETAGYLPGDVMIVDLNGGAEPGDVVCAQLYDWSRSKAETVFRIYEPPYLVPATFDPRLRRIIVVDNENAMIRGVVIASIRPRQARAA